ncbi:MAG: hypothetical protein LWY06_04945 [Firmicutes bacterium]|nr:hypothetical protein [Bacillota bacterium]
MSDFLRKYHFGFVVLLFVCLICSVNSVSWADEVKGGEGKKGVTVLTPVREAKIVSGRNLVYCATFQLAWNELCHSVLKGKALMEGSPLLAEQLNGVFEREKSPAVTGGGFIAMSGTGGSGIIEKINRKIESVFKGKMEPVNQDVGDEDIFVYAALLRNFPFSVEYDDIHAARRLSFKGEKVKFFGVPLFQDRAGKMQELKKQTQILKYDEKSGEFIVRMESEPVGQELILASVKPGDTLGKTYDKVMNQIKSVKPESLEEQDTLAIPEIEFSLTTNFDELTGKKILNKANTGITIGGAVQAVSFHLDKTGARLKSNAELLVYANGKSHKYRQLVFSKPFLICMKEKKLKTPYFLMWVDNSGVMKLQD